MDSIWTENISLPHFEALEGSVNTDVLIIGGGITGILCAYFLQEMGVDYILAEGKRICMGITKNTTAKITSQHGLQYARLLKSVGAEKARLYLDANQKALKKYLALSKSIDCDLEEKTAYVYSLNDRRKLEEEAEALRQIGFDAQLTETKELPFQTAGAIAFANQAQFHPLKFLSKIAENLKIYENTFVKELAEHTAVTQKGTIFFQKVIFATHFPIDNKHGMYFLKLYQYRSYVIALENAAKLDGMYVDEAKGGLSFRSYKDLLLIGGGGHRTGKKGGNWQRLREFAAEYYTSFAERSVSEKAVAEKYCWATQDCMTLDGIPYIGRYSNNMPECFVAAGYNKWGMTSAMTAAMMLTDMVLGQKSPYEEVFDPSRSMLKLQLVCNSWEAVTNLLTFSKKRCPHLGCTLKWNGTEHSWDCPCHGSRFDTEGGLLDNPANGDIGKEKVSEWRKV